MAKEPVIAFTVAFGDEARKEAAHCEKTFRYHHPEIPFFCFGDEEYRLMTGDKSPSWLGEIVSLRSAVGWFLSQFYEKVVYLDTDIFVLAPLEDLVRTDASVLLTSDLSTYVMRVPELPTINSGVLSASDDNFWKLWTWCQYAYLLPAQPKFYFNQLALRLMAHSESISYAMLDEWRIKRVYNCSVHEYPGEFRAENTSLFKGDAQIMLYHMAGMADRSIGNLPPAVKEAVENTLKASEGVSHQPHIDFASLWQKGGEAFDGQIKDMFRQIPVLKLDQILAEAYASTPGYYRSAAPLAWDKERNLKAAGFQRILNTEKAHFFLYTDNKTA